MKNFILGFLFSIGSLSSITRADSQLDAWQESEIHDQSKIEGMCGNENFSMENNGITRASVYKYKKDAAKVIVCHLPSEKPSRLTSLYVIKKTIGGKTALVHSEGEVMPWGAQVTTAGKTLKVTLFWPSDKKTARKIRDFEISCDTQCTMKEKCEIQRLSSDLKPNDLFAAVEKIAGNKKKKSEFIDSNKQKDELMYDQLFAEALSGSKKARDLIYKLSEGMDASGAEITGTYLMFLKDLKAANCSWEK